MVPQPQESDHPKKPKRRIWWRVLWLGLSVLLIAFVLVPGALLARQLMLLRTHVKALEQANHQRDFAAIKTNLTAVQSGLEDIQGTFHWVGYLGVVPGIGAKYRDANDALTAVTDGMDGLQQVMPALSRMAPLAGYRSGAPAPRSGGAKIQAFVSELPVMGPTLKRAYPDFVRADRALQQAHPHDFQGVLAPIGRELLTAQTLLHTVVKNMPLVYRSTHALQNILGYPTQKRYLLVFQNSGELRATGGFMTAYGYVTVDHGRLGKIKAQNMYLLDAQVTYRPPASTVIATYLPVYYWHLRDANTSPNVPTTVGYIKRFYRSIPGAPPINGVIFIDTWFVDRLIGDVGGITVHTPKGPVSLTESNANKKMEYMAEGQGLPDSIRKKFIGTMMKTLFHDVMHSHGLELARVLKTVNQSLDQKFILLNFNNRQAENLAKRYNWGGVMDQHVPGDYLSVVDENLLGHKDNYEMSYHIRTRILKVGSRYQEVSSISYRDPAIDNGWLFVPYRSWVRFYVPMGSQLISITGVDGIPPETYADPGLDKTVFGGHVDLPARTTKSQPVATHTVTVRYWLPSGTAVNSLTVQLQPGVNHQTLTVIDGQFHRTVAFVHDMAFKLPRL